MKKILFFFWFLLALTGCVDPYQMETNTFEDAIVVEATVTNENKRHQIKITRAYRLEDSFPMTVTDATVNVNDDSGNEFGFSYSDGLYLSDESFAAIPGRTYTLNITADGNSYQSSAEVLTTINPIESVDTNVVIKDGVRGVQISVNSNDPTRNSNFYRFEYEETYRIVAPNWSPNIATVILDDEYGISLNDTIIIEPRTYEAKTCYTTDKSVDLFLASTVDLSEDRISDFPIRFISADDPIIRHRYSIKVLQYIQSLAAHTFYETLKELNTSGGNILSQNQPGFFYGNMRSATNSNEKIIGFFEVSSVAEKRIFFDFEDLFPDDQPPPYFYECEIYELDSSAFSPPPGLNQGTTVRGHLLSGNYTYVTHTYPFFSLVKAECGDCTTFSSNVIPDFWE